MTLHNNLSTERLIYHQQDSIRATLQDFGIQIDSQELLAIEDDSVDSTYSFCSWKSAPGPAYELEDNRSRIPYRNILWVQPVIDETGQVQEDDLEITYVKPKGKLSLEPVTLRISIQNYRALYNNLQELSNSILAKSYKNHIVKPSVLVIINPHGGQGKALKIYNTEIKPILKAARAKITIQETSYHKHGIDIGRELDISKYDVIACCSGDGIPHEIINGFYERPDKGVSAFNKIAITQLPCGSGNALSLSTHGSNDASMATFHMLKAKRTKLDLMAVTQGVGPNEKIKLSFLTQCYGVIADADIGTEHLRWMGAIRFDVGVLHGILARRKFPCELYVDFLTNSKQELSAHFDTYHQNSNSTAARIEHHSQDDGELPLLNEERLQVKGPKLNHPPPESWTKISQNISDNVNILYVGKMPYISNDVQFFPAALPNDGSMDMILTDTKTSVMETASILMSLDKGLHVHNEKVHHAKISSYRLIPKIPRNEQHYISVDGESFPFEPLQVEVLPGVLTGLLQGGNFVDTCFSR
ncbi:hypothetical protein G9P44_001086 [Scheffersomyces stipitis]|nr:hypothetical protein G9P44_001086 [Scheffersomyces stipitis]